MLPPPTKQSLASGLVEVWLSQMWDAAYRHLCSVFTQSRMVSRGRAFDRKTDAAVACSYVLPITVGVPFMNLIFVISFLPSVTSTMAAPSMLSPKPIAS